MYDFVFLLYMNNQALALRIGNIILFLGLIIINILSNSLPINDVTIGEVTYNYPHRFIPASYAFTIWSAIYLLLLLFCLHQSGLIPHLLKLRNSAHTSEKSETNIVYTPVIWARKIGIWFMLSCALNICWVFSWHYGFLGITVMLMVGLLVSLSVIYNKIAHTSGKLRQRDKWFISIPFSLYLGWISVAIIANIATWLISIGVEVSATASHIWAGFMAAVATSLAIWFKRRYNDWAYVIAVAWGLAAVAYRQYHEADLFNTTTIIGFGGAIVLLITLFLPRSSKFSIHKSE